MADGAKLASAYIELTVKAKGNDLARIKGDLQDVENVGKQTLANLRSNYEQTFKAMGISSQQATVQWTQDMTKQRQLWSDLEAQRREYYQHQKTGLLPKEYLDEEARGIQKLREEYKKAGEQMAEDRKRAFQAFSQDAQWHKSVEESVTAWRKGLGKMKEETHSIGPQIANAISAPIEFAARKLVGVFEGVWEKIKSGARMAFLGISGLVSAAFGAALYKGIDQLAQIDKVGTKMRFLGQDAAVVNAVLKDMNELSYQTGMSFNELSEKANAFLQAGIKSGDINQVMQDVVDVAAATNQSVSSVSDTFMRMISGNTERMQYQLQTWQAGGFPIFTLLEKQYGESAKGIAKMIKDHKIGWTEIQAVIEGHLHGIAQAMDDTFTGKIKKIWDGLANVGAAILQPFFGGMSAGLGKFVSWIDELTAKIQANQPQIVRMVGEIGSTFIDVAISVVHGTGSIIEAFANVTHAAGTVAAAMGNQRLGQSLWDASDSMHGLVSTMRDTETWLESAQDKWEFFTEKLAGATTVMQALGDAQTEISDTGVILKDNTPEVEQRLTALGMHLEQMPDGKLKITPNDAESARILDQFLINAGQKPIYQDMYLRILGPDGKPIQGFQLGIPGTITGQMSGTRPPAPTNWDWLRGRAPGGAFSGKPTDGLGNTYVDEHGVTRVTVGADGFISGSLPKDATIQKSVGPQGLVQWAEPSTDGEAFIPLSASNRDRSLDIWAQTGRLLGVFDTGGMFPQTTTDFSPGWWKWLGRRDAWAWDDGEIKRVGKPQTPRRADRWAQEDTLTGVYNQSIPGHLTAPYTHQFSPSAGDYPMGPGNINPNITIDTSMAEYLPTGSVTGMVNPMIDTMLHPEDGFSPQVQINQHFKQDPFWSRWWEGQYNNYKSTESFDWGIRLRGKDIRDEPYFNRPFQEKDPSNFLRHNEIGGPWWGFNVPKFASGGWFGSSKSGWGGSGGSGGSQGWFTGAKNAGYGGVGGIRLWAGQLQRLIYKLFPSVKEIGGYRAHDPYPDHPSGEAIDVMIPGWNTKAGVALGNRVKDFTMKNAKPLHVDYDIWRQAMWYPGKAPQGMTSRGSATQNHMDHVHIRVKRGGGGPDTGRGFPGGLRSLDGSWSGGGDYGGYGDSPLTAMMGPSRPAWLPGSKRMLQGLSFDTGGFRWPWKRDTTQIGPFPVPPSVGANAKPAPQSSLGRAGTVVVDTSPPGPKPRPAGPQLPKTGPIDVSGFQFPGSDDEDSGDDSSSDSTDPPYYPGTMTMPDDSGYFSTSDFLNDPRITPAEAKRLRNAADKIEKLNERLDIANQQLAELKANPKTKPSTIAAKQNEIKRLQHDRDNAVDDLNQLQTEVMSNKDKGGKGGVNPALEGNPYYKLMQAEKMKQEAYADILPDFGALGDIGIGGLKESLLPPGFSDPSQWGVTQAASGLFNFLGGIMPDPYSAGAFNILGSALGGSGSGVASAIKGMIPQPYGALDIGSPDEAPGSNYSAYTGEGGASLPLGAIPRPGEIGGQKRPGRIAGSAVDGGTRNTNNFITNVQGDSHTAVTDGTLRQLQKKDAPVARRHLQRG